MSSPGIPPGELIADGKNRTELQSIVEFSISSTHPSPTHVSISNPKLTIVVSSRQAWSAHPELPLTHCTRLTPLNTPIPGRDRTGGSICPHLKFTQPAMNRVRGPVRLCIRTPGPGDWQKSFGFVTLPPAASGGSYNVAIELDFAKIFPSTDCLQTGIVFEFGLWPLFRREPGISWWNWGDLEGGLKGKSLEDICDPELNGWNREDERDKLPQDVVLSFNRWEDPEDGEGNEMVWLEEVYDHERLVKVEFVD